nr:RagB/SusD family nutrient uptake outer membrane protein [Chitinophaga sedimenti]
MASEYSVLLRLAEQYLIRAEARVKQDKVSQAIDDLDMIRNRAGLSLIKITNPTITKDDLIEAIFEERQLELFTEQGHRWLDIKRLGKVDAVMMAVSSFKGITWDTRKQLWPLPFSDTQNGTNLDQNPSYN